MLLIDPYENLSEFEAIYSDISRNHCQSDLEGLASDEDGFEVQVDDSNLNYGNTEILRMR